MRLLADMNISPRTVDALNAAGMDCVRVSADLAANASDLSILDWARDADRIVLTQDNDFAALLALGGHTSPSVVTIRMAAPRPEQVAARLIAVLPVLAADLETGGAAVVTEQRVRVRSLPIGN